MRKLGHSNNTFEDQPFIDGEIIQDSYIKSDSTKKNNKNKGSGKKIISYIIIGLVCASLGGGISSFATIKYYNNLAAEQKIENNIPNNNNNIVKTTNNTVPLSVANIARQVGPAVVGVATKSMTSYDVFGFPEQQEGMGSGIIFNEDGYILTNYHVVKGARQINVILNEGKGKPGKEIPAKLINYDATLDVAVIKLTEKVQLPGVAEFGDSDNIEIGEPAVAIGNPLGKEFLGTVTAGVVSAVDREIQIEGEKHKYIQTDAAINPGNSGGALVNVYGQIIGINSAKIGGSQVEGIGFAIPINEIKPKIEHLLKPILKIGIVASDIDSARSKRYNVPVGIYIHQIEEFSPAEKSGLLAGDVIVKFDGKKVKQVTELNKLKQSHNVGDVVKVELVRNGKTKTLDLKLTN
ncbi:trypsin-like peptidase domain-containing protein [Clostridium aestuarii]|uniref:Trypsin-like peptidase domain-containing protein n=1 Tax=Clostridium aestuarii TaxID=338193 RepID=A0ABT4D2S5_9CLOT|nr:trypsin-like peptidase domain-containing protein [Clostridium aestuarii]MCY6484495.1 trypsin-like peptidase domain-containing protein [Clostridium aestuarii]